MEIWPNVRPSGSVCFRICGVPRCPLTAQYSSHLSSQRAKLEKSSGKDRIDGRCHLQIFNEIARCLTCGGLGRSPACSPARSCSLLREMGAYKEESRKSGNLPSSVGWFFISPVAFPCLISLDAPVRNKLYCQAKIENKRKKVCLPLLCSVSEGANLLCFNGWVKSTYLAVLFNSECGNFSGIFLLSIVGALYPALQLLFTSIYQNLWSWALTAQYSSHPSFYWCQIREKFSEKQNRQHLYHFQYSK